MKPVFKHRITPLEINVGNQARFECDTEDAPNVSFKWFKDGHPIKEGDKYRIISRFTASSLEVLSPAKDDSGEYTCKASNQHGSDECSASLNVTGKSDTFPSFLLVDSGLFQTLVQTCFIFLRNSSGFSWSFRRFASMQIMLYLLPSPPDLMSSK